MIQGSPRVWTVVEVGLGVAILTFTVLVLAIQAILITKSKSTWHPNSMLRFMGLTLIMTSALFLVTAGYSAEQMAPAMGLLGTIAGYLLGAGESKRTGA